MLKTTKVAVSLPVRVSKEIDKLAAARGATRSAVHVAALEEYLERHDPDAITRSWDELAAEMDTRLDAGGRAAAQGVARRLPW